MTKILNTGGAGYIGSVLTPLLLEKGFKVTVFDSFLYGGSSLLPFISNRNFTFIKGDIRDKGSLSQAIKDNDIIVHLAAIVGAPTCNKDPKLAHSVNVEGTKNVISSLSSNQQLIFASTISNYGSQRGQTCNESSDLNPDSHYAKTKTESEKIVHGFTNSVILRFATGFGVSPRMRLDLLVNNFVYQAYSRKLIISDDKKQKRAFVHVIDISKSILFTIEYYKKMKTEIFNVGDNSLNFTKEKIAQKIKERLDCSVHFENHSKENCRKNYNISFGKINKIGFKTTYTLEEGIKDLMKVCPLVNMKNPFFNL